MEPQENQEILACFNRLIQSLKTNKEKKHKITVFIGAGCSLSSSQKDITTYGIVQNLVKRFHSTNDLPTDWRDLYEMFINDVWKGQGTRNQIELLEDYFKDMKPSVGYQILRWLLDNHYVNDIITTNFDPMIDQIIAGLSYHLIVGEHDEQIGETPPQFTLIKAHGDLKYGGLRFAPGELSKLPDKLSNEICELTKNTVIVIGYRGQDIGILNALYDNNEYNAYWISLDKPSAYDAHGNAQIYSWMEHRNSNANFLYGEKYGCFDTVLTELKNRLIQIQEQETQLEKNAVLKLWKDSPVFDFLHANGRFLDLFTVLYNYIYEQIKESLWKTCAPYYSPSFEQLVSATLNLLNTRTTISAPYYCIENEVDALIFSISCLLWLSCQGYPCILTELINSIKQRFKQEHGDIIVSQEFWQALSVLGDNHICTGTQENMPVTFCFNQNGDRSLSVVLKDINIYEIYRLNDILRQLLLFVPTSGEKAGGTHQYHYKQLLEKNLYSLQVHDYKIKLQMSPMPENDYRDLFEVFFKERFTEHIIGDTYTLLHKPIYVEFTVKGIRTNPNRSIWEVLQQEANDHRKAFLSLFDVNQYIQRSFFTVFEDYLASQSTGLFIVGESGCGKTTALKQWVANLALEKYLVFPVVGHEIDGSVGVAAFGDFFNDRNMLGHMKIMLEQRNQVLLLVFDAINEIQGKFSDIVANYMSLMEFCDYIAGECIWNIKLVISCRYDFYQQLIKSNIPVPSKRSFFPVMEEDSISTTYRMPYFQPNDVEDFIHLRQNGKPTVRYEDLEREYGHLIFLPINLHLILDTYQRLTQSEHSLRKDTIFREWFFNLLNMAKREDLIVDAVKDIINYTIEYRYYLSNNQDNLKTHMLTTALGDKYSDILAIFQWLTTRGVFEKNVGTPNMVQFSHDSIEEFFLTNYIAENFSEKLSDMDLLLAADYSHSSIVMKALQCAFYRTYETDKLAFMNLFVRISRKQHSWLLPVCIDTYFEINSKDTEEGYSLLKSLAQYLLQNEFNSLLQTMLFIYRQNLKTFIVSDISGITTINRVITDTNARTDYHLMALGLYLEADARYLLPSQNDTDKYMDAYKQCTQAEQYMEKGSSSDLLDDICSLKAILLQIQGNLNESIQIMQECYQRQTDNGDFDSACQSALNLGAMYREMTRFDEAIQLYQTIDRTFVRDKTKLSRLDMNIGIIYKNKIQNAMFEGRQNDKDNIGFYETAMTNFHKTCNFAEEKDDVPLRLEIYAELVECSCVGYYLNLSTIEIAESWVNKMGEIIDRYPIPIERIQYFRMQARVDTLKCEFLHAISCLEEGYKIAISYNIPFRATDCCNLITGIITDNLDNPSFISNEMMEKGLQYGKYAIDYYSQLKNPSHRYLQDSMIKYEKIKNFYINNPSSNN